MMKSILTTLVLAASVNANAGYIDDLKAQSWDELKANHDVTFEGDKIWFEGKQLSVLDVCMSDEETFRTVEEQVMEHQEYDDFVFDGMEYMYKSVKGTKTMVDYDGTIEVPVVYPTTLNIDVVELDDENYNEFLFSAEYTIPACE